MTALDSWLELRKLTQSAVKRDLIEAKLSEF
jgi:hypothetical protein